MRAQSDRADVPADGKSTAKTQIYSGPPPRRTGPYKEGADSGRPSPDCLVNLRGGVTAREVNFLDGIVVDDRFVILRFRV